ncbi:MAG: hypothetical protein ABMB14_19345 [Myxococcota bacterium]
MGMTNASTDDAPQDHAGRWSLFDLISGGPLPIEATHPASTLQIGIRAALASLGMAALYGAAVGCTEPLQAARNVVALPVVVALAVACALPLGMLVWKVVGEGTRALDLWMSVITGVFTATLLLGASAPLLALYYLTTDFVGAPLEVALRRASARARAAFPDPPAERAAA